MKKTISILPYDPNWPNIFEQEALRIKATLGDHFLEIHHIGSTSVPGLASKPIIDMIIVVKDINHGISSLENIGYIYRGELNIPMRYYFKNANNSVHIHMYEELHPEIELNLMFRDYLRSNTEKRDTYANLKQDILRDESSFIKESTKFVNYTLYKGNFIRSILKEAGFNRLRILKCSDETEWKAAKYFRDTYFFCPYGIEDPYTWTFNHEKHAHLVLYQGTEIIGYAHIQFWPDKRAAMRIIVIDENKRDQNSGSKFLAFIEKWLKNLGIKSIHAESRKSSLNFYLKNGYINMPFDDPEEHESDPNDVPVGKVLT
ncbi:MAG: GNAT family N-acetyltransferase [Alphaproteobacteria bacterium 33-17]|nr:MAG: GNAT family N-acetyltransferase [Alphaproteobacteria bacterium 33-17]